MIDCIKAKQLGICKGGECCGIVPLIKEVIKENKSKIQVKVTEHEIDKEKIAMLTEDSMCAFLNRQTKRCEIYESRPEICRIFGTGIDQDRQENVLVMCPHLKPSGKQRSEANKKHLIRRVKQVEDAMFKKLFNHV